MLEFSKAYHSDVGMCEWEAAWGMWLVLSALSAARPSSLYLQNAHVIHFSSGPQLLWYRANSWVGSVKFHSQRGSGVQESGGMKIGPWGGDKKLELVHTKKRKGEIKQL